MTPRNPKRQRYFEKIEEYKERFRRESSEVLRKRARMVPLRFVITEAVTQSIEASLVESEEAAARIPADAAFRVRHRHALTVQTESGLLASTLDRMLAPPVDIQGASMGSRQDTSPAARTVIERRAAPPLGRKGVSVPDHAG